MRYKQFFLMFYLDTMNKLLISKLIWSIANTTYVQLIRNSIMIIIEFIIWKLLKQKLKIMK